MGIVVVENLRLAVVKCRHRCPSISLVIQLATFALFLAPLAGASSSCPVTLLSGTGTPSSISVTFKNAGKLSIRQLEFNCKMLDTQGDKAQSTQCYVKNAFFFPGTQYTVNYSYPSGVFAPVRVSLKSVTFADGHTWKPFQRESCRVLKIYLRKTKK